MNLLQKSSLALLSTALVAGCAGEADHSEPPAVSQPAASRGTGRDARPPVTTQGDADKGGMSAEMKGDEKKSEAAPPLEGPKADAAKPAASPVKLTDKEIKAIKELPAAEQSVALAQAVCPVSGHHLGAMETPVKVSAEGRTFYLCCEGCEGKVKSDPKSVIAKLDKKPDGK